MGTSSPVRRLTVFVVVALAVVVIPVDARRRRPRPRLAASVQCPRVSAPANGYVFVYGRRTLRFLCRQGFQQQGSSFLTCPRGQSEWDHPPPTCTSLPRCADLAPPENGDVTYTNPYLVRFSCNEGRLRGARYLHCVNGSWSAPPPICLSPRPTKCSDPGEPENGWRFGSNFNVDGVVQYGCYANYRLVGSARSECRSYDGNLVWTWIRPRCEEINPVKELADNIRTNIVDKFRLHTASSSGPKGRLGVVQPNGLDLVLMFDRSSSIAPVNFKRSVNFTLYLLQQFGAANTPNATRVAAVSFGSEAKVEFNLDQYTNSEAITDALNRIQSTGGGTAMYKAFEKVFTRINPELRKNAKRVIFMMSDGQSTDTLRPDSMAYQLKQRHKFEIFAVGVGNDVDRNELKRVASKPYTTHVFSLENYVQLASLTDYILETKPEYERCGIAGKYEILDAERVNQTIEEKRQINEGAWPWLVNIQDNDMNRPNPMDPICGGALICGNWVLTAAQCLEKKIPNRADPQLLEKEDIIPRMMTKRTQSFYQKKQLMPAKLILHFGSHDIHNGSVNEELVMDIKRLVRHPDYATNSQANDIALIELGYNVSLTKYVRTVCVPQQNSNIVLVGMSLMQSKAWTAGWGTTRKGDAAFTVAKQREMEIQGSRDCSRFKPANVTLDANNFCAGYRMETSESCRGDIGAPLVAAQKNDHFSVVAVTTHNAECDQLNGLSVFTSILPYVEWIHNVTGGCNTASNCEVNC